MRGAGIWLVTVSELLVIYRVCKLDSIVDFRTVCVTDGVREGVQNFVQVSYREHELNSAKFFEAGWR